MSRATSTIAWDDTTRPQSHPPLWRVWVGLFGAAAAWAVQLISNYSLVAHFCYPKHARLSAPAFGATRAVVIVVSVVLLGAGVASWVVAWRTWRASAPAGGADARTAGGWGHFAALAGVFVSAIFCFALAMNAVPAFIGALCAGAS